MQAGMPTIEYSQKSSASRTLVYLGQAPTIKSPSQSLRIRICPSQCFLAFQKRHQLCQKSRIRALVPTESRTCYHLAVDTFFLRPKMHVCHSLKDHMQSSEAKGSLGRLSLVMYQVLVAIRLRILESQTDL